jgi:heme exporter protein D
MYFDSFNDFIEMGGHSFYVWLSYAIVLSCLIVYFIHSYQLTDKTKKQLKRFYQRMDNQINNHESSN